MIAVAIALTVVLGPLQAGAWCVAPADVQPRTRVGAIGYPLAAVVALLLVFQLVLRRGILFY